jgi:hypothetical protein
MKKRIIILASVVMALSVFTACSSQSATTEDNISVQADSSSENGEGGENHDRGNRKSAQVTAIDGNVVTLKLSTQDENKEPQGEPATGDMGGERPEMSFDGEEVQIEVTDGMLKSMTMPEGGERPNGEKPDGEQPQGEKPSGEKPDGERPEGGNGFEENLEDMDISELATDDIVNIVYDEDGTTIKYIVKSDRK